MSPQTALSPSPSLSLLHGIPTTLLWTWYLPVLPGLAHVTISLIPQTHLILSLLWLFKKLYDNIWQFYSVYLFMYCSPPVYLWALLNRLYTPVLQRQALHLSILTTLGNLFKDLQQYWSCLLITNFPFQVYLSSPFFLPHRWVKQRTPARCTAVTGCPSWPDII